jgi:hypothetical protein
VKKDRAVARDRALPDLAETAAAVETAVAAQIPVAVVVKVMAAVPAATTEVETEEEKTENRMLTETVKPDIGRVLNNFLDSSYNQLDAFKTQLGLISQ